MKTDAAKRKSLIPAAHAAARFACLVVALLLAQTSVWGFGITGQHESAQITELVPSAIKGNAVVIGYDESDCAVAAKGVGRGPVIIGETMKRVEAAAEGIPGAKILNDMPKFTGTADQVTSQMMQYNRKWILDQMRSGSPIIDIGTDAARQTPSIFYQMEQNMLNIYQKLHPGSLNISTP